MRADIHMCHLLSLVDRFIDEWVKSADIDWFIDRFTTLIDSFMNH